MYNSRKLKVQSIKELSTGLTQQELFNTFYNQNDYSNIGTVDKISVPNGAFPKVGELAQAEIVPTANDLYFVLNPIKNPKERRNQSNTKNIYFCFCDCDLAHKSVMSDSDYIEAYNNIITTNQNAGLPMPTVNFTGRGFLLLWRVNRNGHDLNNTDIDRKYWNMMQNYIHETFKGYEPDTGIKGDYAHIFRVIGTTNSKSGRECINLNLSTEIADIKELCDSLGLNTITVKMRKTMALLQSNGAPEFDGTTKAEAYEYIYKYVNDFSNPATEAQIKYVTDICNKTGIAMPEILNYFTANAYISEYKHLLGQRAIKADHSMRANTAYKTARIIESLAECGEVTEGIRELTLACYHNCVLVYTAGDFDGAAEAVEELNSKLAQPLPINELKATHTNNLTKYSHAGWLQQITGKDWSELISYYDAPAKDRKESNRKTYENRLKKQNKATETDKIFQRRLQVKELLDQKYNQTEISKLLKVTRATISADKKYIENNLSEFESVKNFKYFNYSYKSIEAEQKEEEKKELPLIAIEVEEATEEINNIIGNKTEEEKEAEAIEYAMAQAAEYVANGYGDEDESKNKYNDYDILSYMEHAENRITPDYAKRMAKTLENYAEEEKYNLALFLKSYYYGYYGYTHKLVRSTLPYWVKNDLGAHALYVELDTVEIDILDLGKLVNSIGWHGLQATPDTLHGAEILEFWARATRKPDGKTTRYKLYDKGETFSGHVVTMTFDDLQRVICGYENFETMYKRIINK